MADKKNELAVQGIPSYLNTPVVRDNIEGVVGKEHLHGFISDIVACVQNNNMLSAVMTYSAEEHICYAESDSPCGPFVQREQRPYLPEEKGIDSHIFFDDDKAYIFWVRFEGYGIWAAELSDDLQEIRMERARVILRPEKDTWEWVEEYVSEGPAVMKHKGRYYLTYSCNHYQSKDYAVGMAVADSVLGPYERHADNPILHRHAGYVGTGHHTLLPTKRGLYVVFHAHNSGEKIHPRQTLISPIKFIKDRKQQGKGGYMLSVSDEIIIPKVTK